MKPMTVRDLMKAPPISVHPTTTLLEAQEAMTRAAVHHLPVVGPGGKLVGMVSAHDVERALALLAVVQGKRLMLDVGDICAEGGLSVAPDSPAHEAASMLIEAHADGLSVVDANGTLIGVVTATDFVEVAREAMAGVDPKRRVRA